MSKLVGEALDQDEQFWGHDTWNEEDDEISDGSYDVADERREDTVDHFDSDFNESEESSDEEEVQAEEEEKVGTKRKAYREPTRSSATAKKMYKKDKHGVRRHVMAGKGINAGLVLGKGMPPPKQKPVPQQQEPQPVAQTKVKRRTASTAPIIAPSSRTLRAKTVVKSFEAQSKRASTATQAKSATQSKKGSSKKQRHRRHFTQEELLVECASVTEPENERWIMSRKREQAQIDAHHAALNAGNRRGNTYQMRFHSRRGCFNTLTFPSVDLMPEILKNAKKHIRVQQQEASVKVLDNTSITATKGNNKKKKKTSQPPSRACVITGKAGRYRDPKTNMRYHDVAAFKELRRRLEAGEPLKTKIKVKAPPRSSKSKSASNAAAASATATTSVKSNSKFKPADVASSNSAATIVTSQRVVEGRNDSKSQEVKPAQEEPSSSSLSGKSMPTPTPTPTLSSNKPFIDEVKSAPTKKDASTESVVKKVHADVSSKASVSKPAAAPSSTLSSSSATSAPPTATKAKSTAQNEVASVSSSSSACTSSNVAAAAPTSAAARPVVVQSKPPIPSTPAVQTLKTKTKSKSQPKVPEAVKQKPVSTKVKPAPAPVPQKETQQRKAVVNNAPQIVRKNNRDSVVPTSTCAQVAPLPITVQHRANVTMIDRASTVVSMPPPMNNMMSMPPHPAPPPAPHINILPPQMSPGMMNVNMNNNVNVNVNPSNMNVNMLMNPTAHAAMAHQMSMMQHQMPPMNVPGVNMNMNMNMNMPHMNMNMNMSQGMAIPGMNMNMSMNMPHMNMSLGMPNMSMNIAAIQQQMHQTAMKNAIGKQQQPGANKRK